MLDAPRSLIEFLFSTFWYDHFVSRTKTVSRVRSREARRVAIYLIFPQRGLLASHLYAIKYLIENGFEVVVVSNCKLVEPDKKELLHLVWIVIERPNYGYDFGGYRDALLEIASEFKQLDRLILLNDSTWFPLPQTANWVADVEKLNVDFCGAVSAYGVERQQAKRYGNIDWSYSTVHRNFNYCSFALAFSNNVLIDPGFLKFWRQLRLTNRKNKTVRRGEIGLTQWVIKRDFSHACTFDVPAMRAHLESLPVLRLAEIVQRMILPAESEPAQTKSSILSAMEMTETWRLMAINYVLSCAALHGISYSTAEFNIHEMRFPFLKKVPLWAGQESSQISLSIIDGLEEPAKAMIKTEALSLRERLKPSK